MNINQNKKKLSKSHLQSKQAVNDKDVKSYVNKYLDQFGIYLLFGLLLLLCAIVFRDYIFFDKLYLFKDIGSDTINTFYPQFVHIADYLRNEGIPKWSFNQGMGQNILPFSFSDPFSCILYCLGRDRLAYGIVYVEILKIICGGVVFYFYLRKLSLTSYTSFIGGLLFSFSGFMILGGCWYVFSTQALYCVLLLYSFEKLFQNNSWKLFPLVVALIASFQPFDLYLHGSFLLMYSLFRCVEKNSKFIKTLSVLWLKMIAIGLLGIAISFFFFLNNVLQLLQSPRISGGASYFETLYSRSVFDLSDLMHNATATYRFFSSDLIGIGSNFKGWGNYLESPMFYCGLISLMLLPHLFYFANKKQKALYLLIAALCILPIAFPFFRNAFWLFTGDYYRILSFFISLVLLIAGLNALDKIDKLNKVNLIITIVTLIILFRILHYPYIEINNPINKDLRNFISFLLIIYAVLISLLKIRKLKLVIQIVIVIVLCVELTYFTSKTVNDRPVIRTGDLQKKIGYNDYTKDAVDYLHSIDKNFYRIDKNYPTGVAEHTSINTAKVLQYYGLSSYHSFNQQYYIRFLKEMNTLQKPVEHYTRWAMGLVDRPLLQTFASVKYTLVKETNSHYLKLGYEAIAQVSDVIILKNKNYLPLGFTYDTYIADIEFAKMTDKQKDVTLLKACVLNQEESELINGLNLFHLNDSANHVSFDYNGNYTSKLKQDTLTIIEHGQNLIKGKIQLKKKKILFFSIPYDQGWMAKVDSQTQELKNVNIGFMGLFLDKGEHLIEMEFTPPYYNLSIIISAVSLLFYLFYCFYPHLIFKGKMESNVLCKEK